MKAIYFSAANQFINEESSLIPFRTCWLLQPIDSVMAGHVLYNPFLYPVYKPMDMSLNVISVVLCCTMRQLSLLLALLFLQHY